MAASGEAASDRPQHRALRFSPVLIDNMITGVTDGFTRHWNSWEWLPASMQVNLVLNVGFSHPLVFEPEPNLEIEVPSNTKVLIKGIDKQQVNNFAAVIRKKFPPEPYKGKGIRYENEQVRRKVGKTGK